MCKTIASMLAPKLPQELTDQAKKRMQAAQVRIREEKVAALDARQALGQRSLLGAAGMRAGFGSGGGGRVA